MHTKTPNESNDENEWFHVIRMLHGMKVDDVRLKYSDGLDN